MTAKYRADIDGLRAIAVLAVMAFHIFPQRMAGGFVGVDVFFVISGYLISGIIFDQLTAGSFTIAGFYQRRIRRIFPSLIVVLLACLVAGAVLLVADEYTELGKQVTAGSLFGSNVLLWKQSGYFDTSSSLKPLLHLWSLGVEEQFYFIWPVTVAFIARAGRARIAVISVLLLGSFAANLALATSYPSATFYLPMTRFWELMLGALLAALRDEKIALPSSRTVRNGAVLFGLALIGYAAVRFNSAVEWPGWRAIVPTVGAGLVIAAGEGGATAAASNAVLSNRAAVYVGKISYPLYLWHWPLLVFPTIVAFGDAPGRHARWIIIIASLVLSAATYHLVEKPIRFGRFKLVGARYIALAMAAVALLGLVAQPIRGAVRGTAQNGHVPTEQFRWDYWQNPTCTKKYPWNDIHGWWFCVASSARPPTVILLGDSHANQLYPGLAQTAELRGESLLNIGTCAPADGIELRARNTGEAPCAGKRALEQQGFLKGIIEKNPTIKLAILTAAWPAFGRDGNEIDRVTGAPGASSFMSGANDAGTPAEVYRQGLEREVAFLRAHGIRVAIVYATPELPYDPRSCFDRPFHRAKHTCTLDATATHALQQGFHTIVDQVIAAHPDVTVFDPLDTFCDAHSCKLLADDVVYMRDATHLSVAGSQKLAARLVSALRFGAQPTGQ